VCPPRGQEPKNKAASPFWGPAAKLYSNASLTNAETVARLAWQATGGWGAEIPELNQPGLRGNNDCMSADMGRRLM